MASTYEKILEFNKKYPGGIYWRIKKHASIIDKNLFEGESVKFAFAAQNNTSHGTIFDTAILAVTNQRIIIAQKNIIVGYNLNTITPDLYNDMQIYSGIIWGMITIDTIKETIYFSNIAKSALPAIQKEITSFMIAAKKEYSN